MKYKITIETVTVDPNEQDIYKATKTETIYEQTVDYVDVDLVIRAVGRSKQPDMPF